MACGLTCLGHTMRVGILARNFVQAEAGAALREQVG